MVGYVVPFMARNLANGTFFPHLVARYDHVKRRDAHSQIVPQTA
jgi:hypothetical protein